MLQILTPVLMYIIGYYITHYTMFEIKNKLKLFKKVSKISLIIIILYTFFLIFSTFTNIDYYVVIFCFSLIIFYLYLSKALIKSYKTIACFALIGLLIGYFYQDLILIFLISIFFYFKSSCDYLSKKYLFRIIIGLFVYLLTALISALISNILISLIAIAGLFRLLTI